MEISIRRRFLLMAAAVALSMAPLVLASTMDGRSALADEPDPEPTPTVCVGHGGTGVCVPP